MMVLIVVSTWVRFVGIMLVVKSVSALIVTVFKMLTSGVTFLAILFVYLLIMATIFMTLF